MSATRRLRQALAFTVSVQRLPVAAFLFRPDRRPLLRTRKTPARRGRPRPDGARAAPLLAGRAERVRNAAGLLLLFPALGSRAHRAHRPGRDAGPPQRPGVAAGRRHRARRSVRAGGAARGARGNLARRPRIFRFSGRSRRSTFPSAASGCTRSSARAIARRRSRRPTARSRGFSTCRSTMLMAQGLGDHRRNASATATASPCPRSASGTMKSGARRPWCWRSSWSCWVGRVRRT